MDLAGITPARLPAAKTIICCLEDGKRRHVSAKYILQEMRRKGQRPYKSESSLLNVAREMQEKGLLDWWTTTRRIPGTNLACNVARYWGLKGLTLAIATRDPGALEKPRGGRLWPENTPEWFKAVVMQYITGAKTPPAPQFKNLNVSPTPRGGKGAWRPLNEHGPAYGRPVS